MADRVVKVTLAAQVAEYNRGMMQAAQATKTVGTEAEKLAQKREAFNTLGKGLAVAGAAMVATAALATRAAAQWESAWAGVTKTVDGTPKQMAAVEKGLRDLTKVLPASHTEIAAVAEAAGQLGIQTPNVVAFTKTMIDLGETTNLSAEDAASSLARFVNIMGTSQGEVSNLGSALVGLGNNFATTESEILEMGMRLAGAGKQIGMSEGDVLGLAAALSSVGIEAEAGGSAMSKVMIDIAASVENGGERLQMFADVAGVSAAEFAAQWRTSPSEALSLFVSGLANAESQGKSTLGILAELEITEVRMRDALLRSASAADMFSGAMQMGNEEFAKNNALTEEAAKRYETVESKMAIAGNAINDMAISFGEVLLPAVGAAADAVTGFAGFLGDIPGPVKAIISLVGAATGVITLVGGAALLAVPKIAALKVGLKELDWTMKGLSVAGGVVGAALTGLVVVLGAVASAHGDATQRAQTYAEALKLGGDAAEAEMRRIAIANLQAKDSFLGFESDSAFDAAEKLGLALETVRDAALGNADAQKLMLEQLDLGANGSARQKERLDETGLSLTEYAIASQLVKESVERESAAIERGTKLIEQESDAKGNAADKAGELSEAQKKAAAETEYLAEAAEKAVGDLDDMRDALDEVAGAAIDLGAAKDDALGAINAMRDAAKEEKATFKGTNDESIKFRDSLREVERAHRDSAEAIINNGGSLKDARREWQNGREAVLKQLEAMGLSRKEARKWADANLGSASEVKGALGDVKAALDDANEAAGALPEDIDIKVSADTAPALQSLKAFLNRYGDVWGTINYRAVTTDGSAGGRANGGAITGPGTSKSDSIPIMASNGEHMLTAEDVEAMGGQAGVYAFRRNLHNGVLKFASGGAVTLRQAEDAVARAEAKVRAAKTKAAREKAEADLKEARADLADVRRSFRDDRTDWRTAQRRGENRAAGMGGNGLSLVDELFDLAARLGGKTGEKLRDRALKSEKQYLALEDAAGKASKRLDELKNAAASMAAGVSNAVRSFFNLGNLGASSDVVKTRSRQESVTVGGRSYTFEGVESYTETTGPTVGSILSGTKAAAKGAKAFADKLKRLAGMGVNGKLLEEIALLGVENGGAIADVLLTATAGEISDLNAYYRAVGKYSDAAGATVADANFEALIASAQKNNDSLQKKLETETTRVIKAITDALNRGVKKAGGGPVYGPGTGTSDSIPAFLSNGENVWSAAHVDAWGGQGAVERLKRMGPARYAKGGPVLVPTAAAFSGAAAPLVIQELVVKDQDGALIGRMRVEANNVVHARGRDFEMLRGEVV